MSPTLTTFLFEAANFLVLAAVLGWLFFQPVRQALSEYRAHLDALAIAADEKEAAAEKLRAEAESRREAMQSELIQLRQETLEAARQEAERIVAEARERATRTKMAAEQYMTHLEEAQATALARAVAAAAGTVVGRLLSQLDAPDLNAGLLRAACDQLRTLDLDTTPVIIEAAQPLGAEEQSQLGAALGRAAAGATYRVVAELGGGVRVTTSRGMIDASVSGLAQFARQSLADQLTDLASKGTVNGR